MPELFHGKNSSIEINSTQAECLQDLEWENLGIAKAFTRALKRARAYEKLREEKKREIREIERKWDL